MEAAWTAPRDSRFGAGWSNRQDSGLYLEWTLLFSLQRRTMGLVGGYTYHFWA